MKNRVGPGEPRAFLGCPQCLHILHYNMVPSCLEPNPHPWFFQGSTHQTPDPGSPPHQAGSFQQSDLEQRHHLRITILTRQHLNHGIVEHTKLAWLRFLQAGWRTTLLHGDGDNTAKCTCKYVISPKCIIQPHSAGLLQREHATVHWREDMCLRWNCI